MNYTTRYRLLIQVASSRFDARFTCQYVTWEESRIHLRQHRSSVPGDPFCSPNLSHFQLFPMELTVAGSLC